MKPAPDTAPAAPTEAQTGVSRARRPRPLPLRVHDWLRWLHIYISMFSLLAILFFSLTGITLNHPDWAFTNRETKTESKGQFPPGWKQGGKVDWFVVAEHLRDKNGVRGVATDKESDETEGSITFKAPGLTADCFFQTKTGKYDLTLTAQGFIGVLNDFHRGQNAGGAWKWAIDISGALLAVVALTGLGLLYYLKKVRVAAFIAMGAGILLVFIAMKLAF